MEAIFVILFIGIILLKHFGAVVRDNNFDNHFRRKAKERGEIVYWGQNSPRYVKNNHNVRVDTDKYLGRIVTDLVTGEKYYQDLNELLEEYHKYKGKQDYRDLGDVWYGRLGETYGYVDKETEQVYFLGCVKASSDMNKEDNYGDAWFYITLDRNNIVRRTLKQKERDSKQLWYTDEEIENYEDKWANSPHGDKYYRETNGKWIPQGVEPNWL